MNMDMFDIIFFRTGIIALFGASLLDTAKRQMPEWVNKIVFALIAICLWNLFIHTFNAKTLHESMNLFLAIVGFYIVYGYWDIKQSMRKYILWAGIVNLTVYGCQKVGFNPFFNSMPYVGQEGAFLGNQPRLMTYFALLTPFLWWPLLSISIFLGLYANQIIIFAPVAVCLFAKMRTKKEKIIYIVLVFLTALLLKDRILFSLSYRFNIAWKPILTEFFKQPLIGLGLGVSPIPELEVMGNSYLQFITGVGIVGAVWFGYVFKNIYRKLSYNAESIALISLGIIMLIEYPIEITRLRYLIMAILVMWLLKTEEVRSA